MLSDFVDAKLSWKTNFKIAFPALQVKVEEFFCRKSVINK